MSIPLMFFNYTNACIFLFFLVSSLQWANFQVLRALHFSKGLRSPLKVNIQFKVKIQFPNV